jgi:hypothetical protein
MALNSSGPISIAGTVTGQSIQVELNGNGTTQMSLNDAAVRTLAAVPSGEIAMPTNFYGKANLFSFTILTSQQEANLRTLALAAGWNGSSPVAATVNAGVYIWSDNTGVAGLTINGSWPGGITLINNGFIIGKGGTGGLATNPRAGNPGGPAVSLGANVSITNNSYIAGGGGGGGAALGGGGGGAGGGNGGNGLLAGATAGAGGAIGSSGGAGGNSIYSSGGSGGGAGGGGGGGTAVFPPPPPSGGGGGGGGGRILPGTGGAGGTGGTATGGAGGSANSAGSVASPSNTSASSGGGGGWGASGAVSVAGSNAGGAGGKAIALNGFSVTYITMGTIYGAVS